MAKIKKEDYQTANIVMIRRLDEKTQDPVLKKINQSDYLMPGVKGGKFNVNITEKEIEEFGKYFNKDLSLDYSPYSEHEFWSSNLVRVELTPTPLKLDRREKLQDIKIKICEASGLVANSLEEYEQGLFPHAKYVIYDENKYISSRARILKEKNEAIVAFSNLSEENKRKAVTILYKEDFKSSTLDKVIVKGNEKIEKEPGIVLEILKMDKRRREMMYILVLGEIRRVIQVKGFSYWYFTVSLGGDIDKAIDYLLDPAQANQDVLEKIKVSVDSKLI